MVDCNKVTLYVSGVVSVISMVYSIYGLIVVKGNSNHKWVLVMISLCILSSASSIVFAVAEYLEEEPWQ